MSCLAHDKRFRSSFHNIINELRNEKRMPVDILRTLPNKCCTCNDENKETTESVIMKEENQLMKLNDLIERVNREKQMNSKLYSSLNRFENLIEKYRGPASQSIELKSVPTPKNLRRPRLFKDSSSSDSEDSTSMEISETPAGRKKQQNQKISKSIKNGTFLFLPYANEDKMKRKHSDPLLDVAKKLQRDRFIARDGHISQLEKQYNVRINMITNKTSENVTEALERAKKGLENLTIRNKNKAVVLAEKQEGEWVLVRSKKPPNQTNIDDFEQALDDLTNRWESCLTIKKRKGDEADNSPRKRK